MPYEDIVNKEVRRCQGVPLGNVPMRITTGIYKGRKLVSPKGLRPTSDMARKGLFDILGDISGLSFLELFAGTGAVGLEALSRGAGEAVLVENNPACIASIRKNIALLKAEHCRLIPKESQQAIIAFYNHHRQFDLVFFDPPYYQDAAKKTLLSLACYDILAPCGLVIAQHFIKEVMPAKAGSLTLTKKASYGKTLLSFYKKIAGVA